MATYLEIDVDDVTEALAADGCLTSASLDLPVGQDKAASPVELLDEDDMGLALAEVRPLLAPAVGGLAPQEKPILVLRFFHGWTQQQERLVLGHESLGWVREAPPDGGFQADDLVVGVVRRPDPAPCEACANGDFDMCRNGRYTEHGIKEIDGFASDVWTCEADYAVKLDQRLVDVGMLMESTSVVAKAWEQVEWIGARSWFDPKTVLVTGAGPIVLLAALLGTQRGLDVHVLDRVSHGPKPEYVESLGANHHVDEIGAVTKKQNPAVVIEATGVGELVFGAMVGSTAYGILCLTGVSLAGGSRRVDAGLTNRDIVLEKAVVVGSVNANLRHYAQAADALANARSRLAEPPRGAPSHAGGLQGRLRGTRGRREVVLTLGGGVSSLSRRTPVVDQADHVVDDEPPLPCGLTPTPGLSAARRRYNAARHTSVRKAQTYLRMRWVRRRSAGRSLSPAQPRRFRPRRVSPGGFMQAILARAVVAAAELLPGTVDFSRSSAPIQTGGSV